MKLYGEARLENVTSDNCIEKVKHSLTLAEKYWASGNHEELLSYAKYLRGAADANRRLGLFLISDLGAALAEYAFLLVKQTEEESDIPALLSAVEYMNSELVRLNQIRESARKLIIGDIAATQNISLSEAEVFVALSDKYDFSFDSYL